MSLGTFGIASSVDAKYYWLIYIYMTGFGVSSFAAWCIVTLGDLAMVSCEVGGVWHHQFCDQVTVLLYCVFWGGLAFPVWFGLVYGDCGFGMFWH